MEKGAGVIFSMPIGGGHRTALAEQADAQANAARAALAARMAVQETASGDIAEVRFRYESWQRAREALDAQVAALVKLRRGQAAGEIDLSDVLFGERQVQDAFRAEAAARRGNADAHAHPHRQPRTVDRRCGGCGRNSAEGHSATLEIPQPSRRRRSETASPQALSAGVGAAFASEATIAKKGRETTRPFSPYM
jgi:hypothetical protein